jgi:hypothetical protein
LRDCAVLELLIVGSELTNLSCDRSSGYGCTYCRSRLLHALIAILTRSYFAISTTPSRCVSHTLIPTRTYYYLVEVDLLDSSGLETQGHSHTLCNTNVACCIAPMLHF